MVLFASDNKVLQYAKNVQARFTRHGIDVFMQTNLSEVGLARGKGPHWIRPSHLSMVISATKADFLIVVGDRNMRNETCQGRRSGKLVEMGVTERITAVLQSWARDHSVDSADAKGAEGLDSLQLSDRLHTYAGVGRALDRVERLEADAAAAARWRPPVRRAGSILSDHDAEMASLVTQVQTQGIRLHRELSSSLPILTELPVLPKVRANFVAHGSSAAIRPPCGLPHCYRMRVNSLFCCSIAGGVARANPCVPNGSWHWPASPRLVPPNR